MTTAGKEITATKFSIHLILLKSYAKIPGKYFFSDFTTTGNTCKTVVKILLQSQKTTFCKELGNPM